MRLKILKTKSYELKRTNGEGRTKMEKEKLNCNDQKDEGEL